MNALIFEEKNINAIEPEDLDLELKNGWRHFGRYFFRYNMNFHEDSICNVLPLRINLEGFTFAKYQRKILSRNKDFNYQIRDIVIDEAKKKLFYNHVQKFTSGAPTSLYDFLSSEPSSVPCRAMEISVYDQNKLIAASFFDISKESISGIYGMYDLDYHKSSLGIYTMLLEISFAKELNKSYYYHGYCYDIPSFYDYKKKFNNVEYYDWAENWYPFESHS